MAVYKSKKPTKDGRQYFFRIKYKDIFGETHDYTSRKFKEKKEVEIEEAKFKIKVAEQKAFTSNVTLKNVFEEFIYNKSNIVKPQTLKKDKLLFRYLSSIESKKINDINLNTYKALREYISSLNCSCDFKNKILGLFKQLIVYSSKYHNTSDSVVKFIEKFKDVSNIKKEMIFFTYDEYKKFDNVIQNFDDHVFFEVLYFLGLRQGECCALTWKDVNFENNSINVNKTITTKIKGENWTISSPKTKNSIRILPMTKQLVSDLKTLNNNAKKYSDYSDNWFVFGNSVPFKETTIGKKKNKYCKDANVKQIRIHDFRHSCASLLINKGASISLVSKYLGHSKVSTTLDIYTHMYKSELENITEKLNSL